MGPRLAPLLVLACLLAAAVPAAGHEPDRSVPADKPLMRLFGQPQLTQTRDEPSAFAAQAQGAPATPKARCGPGSDPEPGLQGRNAADAPGREDGFRCNTSLVGHHESGGGYKVLRYVDEAGRECAIYDTTLLFPLNALNLSRQPTGVAVLDMTDPSKPVRTASLQTPAMQTPHESLVLNQRRGLLVAIMGNPAAAPGVVDVYDLSKDCRKPVLQSSLPLGYFGHESGFAPDGMTFYGTSLGTNDITAIGLEDPKRPRVLWRGKVNSHGLTVSDDGTRAYLAGLQGLIILDTSEIQARKPDPQVRQVSRLAWPNMTIPQVAHPVTIKGRPYLVEVDEFSADENGNLASHGIRVGAGRIIDIADETRPRVVSELRLEVHQPEHRAETAGDPGTLSPAQGYAGHYCNVPQRAEPGIVACSFIASGLRVFDIRDPERPKELAYFVAPPKAGVASLGSSSNYAMSSPDFVPERREIWYSDGNSGFYNVRVADGVWPFAGSAAAPSLGLPSTRTCASRRSFRVRVRGKHVRSARLYVNGKLRAKRSGRRLSFPVNLKGLPAGTVRVRIVATTRSGERKVDERRYRTCVKRRR
jgi:hypothetical protein